MQGQRRRVAVVVNPTAGKRQAVAKTAVVGPYLESHGVDSMVLVGASGDESSALLRDAVADGVDGVVVVGGDGMVHLAAQRLAGTDVPLGLIPSGTGNDIARYLGLDRKDPLAGARAVAAGRTRRVDLMDVGGRMVVTVVATGFDSIVNERANQMRWPRGQMRYNIATVRELPVFEPLEYSVELDGLATDLEAMLVAVGNGPSYGGGLRISEGAAFDDGLLDVIVIKPLSKVQLLRLYPRLFNGSHVHHPAFERHTVKQVTLSSPGIVAYGDGERIAPLPVTVSVVAGGLRMYAPAAS